MAKMTHVMVDSETTGTNPLTAGVIQLAAVQFNLETGDIGPFFDRCPKPVSMTQWSDGTREFWTGKNREVYDTIVAREEEPLQVYKDFVNWICAADNQLTFVAKPVKFDWPIIEAQFERLGLIFPFNHSAQLDMNSYMQGLRGASSKVDVESEVTFTGKPHNALHDCVYQLKVLLHAKAQHIKCEVVR